MLLTYKLLCFAPKADRTWSIWFTEPSCAGGLSGITRTSSRNLGSIITKDAAGAAFIITPPCALLLMASSFASEVFSPLKSTSDVKRLRYPRAGGPEGIPVRPERHNPSALVGLRGDGERAQATSASIKEPSKAFPRLRTL